jgi:hypothetical protein
VLADILGREGTQLPATEIRQRNLANADHLAVLNAIWAAELKQAQDARYRELVMAALPSGHRHELSHHARWLYRTLRSAELAGLDPHPPAGLSATSPAARIVGQPNSPTCPMPNGRPTSSGSPEHWATRRGLDGVIRQDLLGLDRI